jgi:hypothetical protein
LSKSPLSRPGIQKHSTGLSDVHTIRLAERDVNPRSLPERLLPWRLDLFHQRD